MLNFIRDTILQYPVYTAVAANGTFGVSLPNGECRWLARYYTFVSRTGSTTVIDLGQFDSKAYAMAACEQHASSEAGHAATARMS
jgi:hypothetical protein